MRAETRTGLAWGRRVGRALLLSCAAFAVAAASASAASLDFAIQWTSLGPASAGGTMTIDDAVFLNPGVNGSDTIPWVTAFSVTVTGAASGNGTFTLADFSNILLDTNGGTLDLGLPLIGQNNGGLFDPAGGGGAGGDFNLFSMNPAVPNGVFFGAMATSGGTGDGMSVAKIMPLPLPTDDQKCQGAIAKVGGKYLATRHAALAQCYGALLGGKEIFEDGAKTIPVKAAPHCPDELKTAAKVAKARQALRSGLEKKCTDAILARLFACAETVDGLANAAGTSGCLVDSIDAQVGGLLLGEYGL